MGITDCISLVAELLGHPMAGCLRPGGQEITAVHVETKAAKSASRQILLYHIYHPDHQRQPHGNVHCFRTGKALCIFSCGVGRKASPAFMQNPASKIYDIREHGVLRGSYTLHSLLSPFLYTRQESFRPQFSPHPLGVLITIHCGFSPLPSLPTASS